MYVYPLYIRERRTGREYVYPQTLQYQDTRMAGMAQDPRNHPKRTPGNDLTTPDREDHIS
jgi:hypothetical protein